MLTTRRVRAKSAEFEGDGGLASGGAHHPSVEDCGWLVAAAGRIILASRIAGGSSSLRGSLTLSCRTCLDVAR